MWIQDARSLAAPLPCLESSTSIEQFTKQLWTDEATFKRRIETRARFGLNYIFEGVSLLLQVFYFREDRDQHLVISQKIGATSHGTVTRYDECLAVRSLQILI